MNDLFNSILDFVALHPFLAIAIAFLVSMTEALFIIGLFAPTTTVLFGIGSLIGLGKLPFWPIFAATAGGAIVGDFVSYWLGWHYGWRLVAMRPFVRYGGLIREGQRYFAAHGGKSVVISRWIPGVKAVVPAIAAMSGMGLGRFSVLNILSALAWAAAHLVPGVFAGLALAGIGTISKRLAVLIAVTAVAVLLAVWLARRLMGWGGRQVAHAMAAIDRRARGRPDLAGRIAMRLVGPEHGDFRVLLMLCGVIFAAVLGFVGLLDVVSRGSSALVDLSLSQFLQSLRTSWSDAVVVPITMLGDAAVLYPITLVTIAFLLGGRRFRLAGGVLVAALSAAPFVHALKPLVGAERPLALYSGTNFYSFPSGHAAESAVIYGVLGFVFWQGIGGRAGRTAGAACLTLVLAICFSRVYLGAHWPTDVLAGLIFGAAVVAAFALVFRKDMPTRRGTEWLAAGALVAMLGAGSWHIAHARSAEMAFYAARPRAEVEMDLAWRVGGWRALPDHRIDIVGGTGQPILLQWRGSVSDLRASLAALGWAPPPPWTITAVNRFAVPGSGAGDLPVLPRFHRGMAPVLSMIRPVTLGDEPGRLVLRAWQERVDGPGGGKERLLVAAVFAEVVLHPAAQFSVAVPADETDCPAAPTLRSLPSAEPVGRALAPAEAGCGGRLVLAGTEPGPSASADPAAPAER